MEWSFFTAFGDLLSAGRYTYVVQCSDPEKIATEIEDRWCDTTDDQGLIVQPDVDPGRDLGFDWQGFTVLRLSIEVDEEDRPIEQGRDASSSQILV